MYSHSHGDIYKKVGGGLTGEPQKSTTAEWEPIQWNTTQQQRWTNWCCIHDMHETPQHKLRKRSQIQKTTFHHDFIYINLRISLKKAGISGRGKTTQTSKHALPRSQEQLPAGTGEAGRAWCIARPVWPLDLRHWGACGITVHYPHNLRVICHEKKQMK